MAAQPLKMHPWVDNQGDIVDETRHIDLRSPGSCSNTGFFSCRCRARQLMVRRTRDVMTISAESRLVLGTRERRVKHRAADGLGENQALSLTPSESTPSPLPARPGSRRRGAKGSVCSPSSTLSEQLSPAIVCGAQQQLRQTDNAGHGSGGGYIGGAPSPNDPTFCMHYVNVDRLQYFWH